MQRIRIVAVCFSLGVCAAALVGCEQAERIVSRQSRPTYSNCLQQAVGGGSKLSAEDIRSLCAEAAEVIDAHYNIDSKEQKMVPSNEFTRCYDKQKKEFEAQHIAQAQAIRLAKLSCKYPNVK